MNAPTKRHQLLLTLLIIASIAFITSDQIQLRPKQTIKLIDPVRIDGVQVHSHGGGIIDQADPETQKRMGIYHYNNGNQLLKQNKLEEAINDYKMALHHFKNFDEAYINLSTAYMIGKQFKESLKTLNDLQKISPDHPLLYYNFACYYALIGNTNLGIKSLKQAVAKGFSDIERLRTDRDLKNLRSDPQFRNLQELLSAKKT